MVIGGKTVHLLQHAEPHPKHEILNRPKIHQLCERKEAKPEDIQSKKSSCRKEEKSKVFSRENIVNHPLQEKGIEKKQKTAEDNERHAEGIGGQ